MTREEYLAEKAEIRKIYKDLKRQYLKESGFKIGNIIKDHNDEIWEIEKMEVRDSFDYDNKLHPYVTYNGIYIKADGKKGKKTQPHISQPEKIAENLQEYNELMKKEKSNK